MRSLSSDVDKGLEKGFKPGDLYYGSAKKNNLELELKNYGNIFPEYYIDPFFSGEFKKRISFYVPSHRNAFGYTLKRGLLKYYTDGHKKAVIISAGPDKIYEEFDYISEDPYYNIIPYDPTNGLYSKGDIIMILDTREAYPIYYNNKNNYYQK